MHVVETIKANKTHLIEFYNSTGVLGYRRNKEFQKHLMVSSGVGSTISDFDSRQYKSLLYLKDGDTESAYAELVNQRQCFFNALQGYDPLGFAGATMVYSIDGHVYEDYTQTGLDKILDKFEDIGFTMEQLHETVSMLKKK